MIDLPYAGLDTETTGVDAARDRIVQLAIVHGGDASCVESSTLFNPGCPIPAEAAEVHGITDADVAEAPAFADAADNFCRLTLGRVLVGYNLRRFDKPLCVAELERVGRFCWDPDVIDVCDFVSWHERHLPRKLGEAAERRGVPTGRAHSALDDVRTCLGVWGHMQREGLIPDDTAAAVAENRRIAKILDAEFDRFGWYLYVRDNIARLGFGQYRGQPLEAIARRRGDYLDHMLRKAGREMPPEVRQAFSDARAKRSVDYLLAPAAEAS